MTITFKTILREECSDLGGGTAISHQEILIYNADTFEHFKELINRGLNCWDDAPAELKSFADEIIHGKVLQNYAAQYGSGTKVISTPKHTQALAVQFGLKDVCSECGGLGALHINSGLTTPCARDPRYKKNPTPSTDSPKKSK